MTVSWNEAPDSVLHLAKQIIDEYHPDLESASIAFLYRSEPGNKNGKDILGQAAKFPEKMRPLVDVDYHFLIWLSFPDWNRFTDKQREALLDHELSHCTMVERDGEEFPEMRGHDIEEFNHILERYGFWLNSMRPTVKAVEDALQLPLPAFEEPEHEPGTIGTFRISTSLDIDA